jgi:hypothetical protein
MATQIITVLCEGPHDVAFIYKILRTAGFKNIEGTKLGKYPPPINSFLCQEVTNTNVEELNLQQVRGGMLPVSTLQREQNFIFLYSLGGDGKITERQYMLNQLLSFIPREGEISVLPPDTNLSLLYFFDSDDKGIERRIAELNTELKQVLGDTIPVVFEKQASIKVINQLKLGNFIFTGSNNDKGKLEDTLFPLMKGNNEEIFERAEEYLNTNYDNNRVLPLKLSIRDGKLIEERSTKNKDKDFDWKKSIIGLSGQLQRSGKPNTVYIRDSDYLTLEKIADSSKCQEIIAFFEMFINT